MRAVWQDPTHLETVEVAVLHVLQDHVHLRPVELEEHHALLRRVEIEAHHALLRQTELEAQVVLATIEVDHQVDLLLRQDQDQVLIEVLEREVRLEVLAVLEEVLVAVAVEVKPFNMSWNI